MHVHTSSLANAFSGPKYWRYNPNPNFTTLTQIRTLIPNLPEPNTNPNLNPNRNP